MTPAAAPRPTTLDLRALLAPHRAEEALRERYPARLVRPVLEKLEQIKPLIRSVQWNGRYQLLALTLAEARLYDGSRETLDPVDLAGAPLGIEAALGTELTEPNSRVTRGSYGGGGAGGKTAKASRATPGRSAQRSFARRRGA